MKISKKREKSPLLRGFGGFVSFGTLSVKNIGVADHTWLDGNCIRNYLAWVWYEMTSVTAKIAFRFVVGTWKMNEMAKRHRRMSWSGTNEDIQNHIDLKIDGFIMSLKATENLTNLSSLPLYARISAYRIVMFCFFFVNNNENEYQGEMRRFGWTV